MDKTLDLQIWQIAAAYVFLLPLLFIVKRRKINREKEIIISSIRMTLQLILTGYILSFLFDTSNLFLTVLVVVIMQIFAVYNIFKRVKLDISKALKKIIALSMITGSSISLLYFILVVINVTPWYESRYFIPLSGMFIGNSMTGISLGITRLVEGMNNKKHLIECSLMLGATPKVASKQILDNAFDSAILPTINSMVGMGIVFLPGMMTGQILAGSSPLTAIKYQISIMLGILGSVTLTVIILLVLGYKSFFNEEHQLNI